MSNEKTKPTPTASEALEKIRFELTGASFVWHTLCRVITERTSCEFSHAEKLAQGMIVAGSVVSASPIGLTGTQTFQLSEQ
jgi:hypothetical protein